MGFPPLTRDVRKEMARDIAHPYNGLSSKVVITFDTHGIQILVFPPDQTRFVVPGGPHTLVVKDGRVEE